MAEGVERLDCSFSTITSFLPGRMREDYLGITLINSEPKSMPSTEAFTWASDRIEMSCHIHVFYLGEYKMGAFRRWVVERF